MKRQRTFSLTAVMSMFILGIAAIAAFGQSGYGGGHHEQQSDGFRGGPFPAFRPPVQVKYGGNSVLTLAGRTLTKYDAVTLKQTGVLTIGGDANRNAAANQTGENRPHGHPRFPELLLVVGDGDTASAVIITADMFYRMPIKDFTVATQAPLPEVTLDRSEASGQEDGAPQPPNTENAAGEPGGDTDQPGGPMGHGQMPGSMGRGPMMAQAPTSEIHGNTLYLVRGPQMLAIDLTTGAVTGQATIEGRPHPHEHENPAK